MSLVEHYRSQLAIQQKNRLTWCLLIAVGCHVGAIGWGVIWNAQFSRQANDEAIVPIEFVYFDHPVNSVENPDARVQAQVDSVATQAQPSDISTEARQRSSPITQIWEWVSQELLESIEPEPNEPFSPNQTAEPIALDAIRDEIWSDYDAELKRTIDRHWQPIAVNTKRHVKVRFILDRQGNLMNLTLIQASGDANADRAAIQAIQAADPFAPFPTDASQNTLQVDFNFDYYPTNGSPTRLPQPL
ncbi:MAG: TonB family protein [Cyanobacteria bacterium RU_5_0]|nr:TonB family protein [Cyanobacteria bacterium RU_5_0]